EFCKSTFPNQLHLRGMRIALDCAHGAAYHIAPHVFHELGAEVITIGTEPDGFNINDGVGTTHPRALQQAVKRNKADVGIALDGDGDRVLMADARGALHDGDELLYVIARHQRERGELNGGVVGTQMTNLGLEHALDGLGIAFARARVGDRYVLEMLHARGWRLGGENSGHIVCLERHTTGDGIISALQVLRALRENDATLQEAVSAVTLYPQVLINVQLKKQFDFDNHRAVKQAVARAERDLGTAGRVLLRASGTEPVIRVMVEGKQQARVKMLAESIADTVRAAV
ncbi:MAG TPA: phosphoglucosamine mutase, partial [Burkholderiales bacterium]|nr:phosphoglucosamine mutase [Burkholderiales bacterium]